MRLLFLISACVLSATVGASAKTYDVCESEDLADGMRVTVEGVIDQVNEDGTMEISDGFLCMLSVSLEGRRPKDCVADAEITVSGTISEQDVYNDLKDATARCSR